jgi:hypothetical protein
VAQFWVGLTSLEHLFDLLAECFKLCVAGLFKMQDEAPLAVYGQQGHEGEDF